MDQVKHRAGAHAHDPRVRAADDYQRLPFKARGAGRVRDAAIHDAHLMEARGWRKPAEDRAPRQSSEGSRLSAQLMAVQERERKRIAADLHDGLGQSLSLIKLSMESAMQLMKAGQNQQAVESMQRIILNVRSAMAELRRTTSDLRPPMLDELGIIPTVTWFLRECEAACPDKQIERDISIAESNVPPALRATIFRILQEAANNIIKHADASWVRVRLSKRGSAIQLLIEDNGRGFDPDRLPESCDCGRGFGLLTMKERAASTDGAFEIQSSPGRGTRVVVTWELTDGGHGAAGTLHAQDQ